MMLQYSLTKAHPDALLRENKLGVTNPNMPENLNAFSYVKK